MTLPDFTVGNVPDDPPDSTDLVCQEPGCGEPLVYGGRGRKPTRCDMHKRATSATTTRRSAGNDVESALAILDGAYAALGMTFFMIGARGAADSLSVQKIGLQESNRQALMANRDLARQINKLGKGGGSAAFYITNIMVIGGCVKMAVSEKSAVKQPKSKPATPPPSAPPSTGVDPLSNLLGDNAGVPPDWFG